MQEKDKVEGRSWKWNFRSKTLISLQHRYNDVYLKNALAIVMMMNSGNENTWKMKFYPWNERKDGRRCVKQYWACWCHVKMIRYALAYTALSLLHFLCFLYWIKTRESGWGLKYQLLTHCFTHSKIIYGRYQCNEMYKKT